MDIGRVLKDSWAIFVKDWGALIVAALIMVLLGVVTLGILFVPLSAGLYLMILRRVREGRKAEVATCSAVLTVSAPTSSPSCSFWASASSSS